MTQHRTREEQIHALASNLAGVRHIGAFERESAERQILDVENRVRSELHAEISNWTEMYGRLSARVGEYETEIERLRAERLAAIDAAEQDRAQLQAENERLREALKPFAETAGFFDADGNDFERDYEDDFTLGDPDEEDVLSSLTVGDLRRALIAVSATQQAAWRTDRERLDWLESKEKHSARRDAHGTVTVTAIVSGRGVWNEGDSLRAAVDAAIDREGRGDAQ
ncbi:hypothetical protein ACMAUO_05730 [Gluconacetobacter sp. Hr-1-5]|uniref:hypothetical protein n=1 Tax=Gluconacetobacter sp. Hr-1-5 TaxID=3395370 RepID=UPI003B51842D